MSDQQSDFAEEKKLLQLMRSCLMKAAAVEVHFRNPLANIELMANQLNSGAMTDVAVVYAWGYDDLVELIVCVIEKIMISK